MTDLARLVHGNPLARAERHLPDFVTRRMQAHYVDRMQNVWGGDHLLHGIAPPADALHMSSNDYLDLLSVPRLRREQARALDEGSHELLMSSVFMYGESAQQAFERRLAHFMSAEDGVVCHSGWAANVGLVQTLAGPDVPVYLDMSAHASLWEGAQAAGARAIPFIHNNVDHAQSQIAKHGPGVIVVDSVYSTTGSVAPLTALTQVAEESGSILIVDESHSLGTHGPNGAGLVCALGLADRVHFRTASLAKAFAGRAGFLTCSSEFKGYFCCESRPAIFSSGLLSHEIAWFDAALTFISAAHDRRARLHRMAGTLREGLGALGYNISDGSEQIIALEAGSEPQTLRLRNALQRRGVFGAVFCAPATAKNRSLVRLTLNAGHTERDLERLLRVCADMRDEVDLDNWSSTKRARQRRRGAQSSGHELAGA